MQSFRNKLRIVDYLSFRKQLFPLGCFNVSQVQLLEKSFDRNNLTHWCRKGLLIKLRNQYYAFPEYLQTPDFAQYVANTIYKPSYISLHSALSFYGMIPEEAVQLTNVSTLKTAKFENAFGTFHYQKVKPKLFFGYEIKMISDKRGIKYATPEKAVIDLLHLNSFYRTEQDMEELRLDEYFMQNEFNLSRLYDYVGRIGSRTLEKRIQLLIKVYEL